MTLLLVLPIVIPLLTAAVTLLAHGSPEPAYLHVKAVETLITDWRGQKWVDVPGLKVGRSADSLVVMTD